MKADYCWYFFVRGARKARTSHRRAVQQSAIAKAMAPQGDGDTATINDRLSQLERDLYSKGFDIFHSFHPKWYNESLERDNLQDQLMPLPETGRGFLIGNTKRMWPLFKEWYRQSSSIPDPLDTYCRECIESSLCRHQFEDDAVSVFWSAKTQPNKLVSMQRVAMESGFAYHDSTTQLAIHPTYGCWHSYRAVIILQERNATEIPAPPPPVPCLLTPQEEKCAREAMKRALEVSDTSNLCIQLHGGGGDDPSDLLTVCEAWIAMRDCVKRGKEEYRFDKDQLMYHYTKDVNFLKTS
jgi:hypothetical protein